jgi:hypothetical protein
VNARPLVLALLILSAAIYLGVTRPARQAAGALEQEYRKTRDVQSALQTRLASLERCERERQRALQVLTAAAGRSLTDVRRRLLERLSGLPLSDVRLDIAAAPAPAFAEARVGAQGSFSDVVTLTSRLAQADAGLALRQVSFVRSERDDLVRLALSADTVKGRP